MSIFDFTFFRVLRAWYRSTETCSAYSHGLLYAILVSSVLIVVGGVYVWHRYIRTQPGSLVNKDVSEHVAHLGSVV